MRAQFGDVRVVRQVDDLRRAGGATDELEHPLLHRRRHALERVVEDQRQRLAPGPGVAEVAHADDQRLRQLGGLGGGGRGGGGTATRLLDAAVGGDDPVLQVEGELHAEVAGDVLPAGQGGAVGADGVGQTGAVGAAVEHRVHPLESEGEVGLGASLLEGAALGLAGLLHPPAVADRQERREDGDDEQRHRRPVLQGDGRHGGDDAGAADEDAVVTDVLEAFLGGLEGGVTALDLLDEGRVLGVAAGRLDLGLEPGVGLPDVLGGGPESGLVEAGELGNDAVGGRLGDHVLGRHPAPALGRRQVEPERTQDVDAAVFGGELVADVLVGLELDDPVPSAVGRVEDPQAPAAVGQHLDMGARTGPGEAGQQLGDEALALELADAGDDGEARVQVDRDRRRTGFQEQALEPHALVST